MTGLLVDAVARFDRAVMSTATAARRLFRQAPGRVFSREQDR